MRLLEEIKKIQSLNIVPIDKPKSSIAPIFGNPLEEETTFKEEDDIEEDEIPFSIKRENFVKQIDEIPYFTNFHQLSYSF